LSEIAPPSQVRLLSDYQTVRKRLKPLNLISLLLLALTIFFPWSGGLHDFKSLIRPAMLD
jgi:hypothetical protein